MMKTIDEPIEHLAKFECLHVQPFALAPIVGWWEWCAQCGDFRTVRAGVSR